MYLTFDSTLIAISIFLFFAVHVLLRIIFQMTAAEQAKFDVFRAKVEQRKACEKKAFDTCMQLIEADKVESDVLINAVKINYFCFPFIYIFMQAMRIDQERYLGVNEDRALKELCGYPICSTKLPNDVCQY